MAHILLLEPNSLLATQYKSALEADKHQVTWCQDGQAAILAADKHTPDVLVLELLLAGHSGVEFLYEFRSYNEWAKVPVVVLSAVARPDLDVSGDVLDRLGITSFLYKPEASLAKLRSAVRRASGGAGA